MERQEYATMAALEATHWWYRAQRDMVLDCLVKLPGRRTGLILDAGCGTGQLAARVGDELGARVIGVDYAAEARACWRSAPSQRLCAGDLNSLPFASSSFDVVYSVDVLCCRQVDPVRACAELTRVLRPGGYLVLAVPAYPWLLSEHDAAVHCIRRFDRTALAALLKDAGAPCVRVTHLFPTFLPIIAAVRCLRRLAGPGHGVPRSDLRPMPRWLNETLYAVAQSERWLVRRLNYPIGSTLLGVGQKKGAG